MSRYGEAMTGDALQAQFTAKQRGVYEFSLYPELWLNEDEKIRNFYLGREWESVKFNNPPPDTVPNLSGIYMFVVAPHCGALTDHSYIFYVGKASNLKSRYKEYLKEKACENENPREKVVRFLNHMEGFIYFHFTLVPGTQLDYAEALLKDNLTPFANIQTKIIGRLKLS